MYYFNSKYYFKKEKCLKNEKEERGISFFLFLGVLNEKS